jgi:hypothetical protein
MSRTSNRRAAVLTVLAPLLAAGILTAAVPASAIPFEGDPTPGTTCLRLERLPFEAPAGSTAVPSFRYVLLLSSDC